MIPKILSTIFTLTMIISFAYLFILMRKESSAKRR